MLLGLEHMLAVVHHLAHYGLGISDLHQIQTDGFSSGESFRQGDNPYLFTIGTDKPYLVRLNLIIGGRTFALAVVSLNRTNLLLVVTRGANPTAQSLSGGIV